MRRVLAILATAAVTALTVFVTAGPAAASGQHLCENSSPNYCVGAVTVGYGDPVTEQFGGRTIELTPSGSSDVLQFTNGTNICVGAPTSATHVVVTHCSGDTGILWTVTIVNGHYHFFNNHWGNYLAGVGILNAQFEIEPSGAGYLEAFNFV